MPNSPQTKSPTSAASGAATTTSPKSGNTTPPRTPRNSDAIPAHLLEQWEAIQRDIAVKADYTDARLGFDPSEFLGEKQQQQQQRKEEQKQEPVSSVQQKSSSSPPPSYAQAALGAKKNPINAAASHPTSFTSVSASASASSASKKLPPLRYVGGLDISFLKETNIAVASLCVLDILKEGNDDEGEEEEEQQQQKAVKMKKSVNKKPVSKHTPQDPFPVVYEDMLHCTMDVPYVAGYLGFREIDPCRELIKRIKSKAPQYFPQITFIDGNGCIHPRKCGQATHLGVLEDMPLVGVAKNLLVVDGLSRESTNELIVSATENSHRQDKELEQAKKEMQQQQRQQEGEGKKAEPQLPQPQQQQKSPSNKSPKSYADIASGGASTAPRELQQQQQQQQQQEQQQQQSSKAAVTSSSSSSVPYSSSSAFVYRGVTLVPLIGTSRFMYGFGALTGNSSKHPIFISPGHRVSFRTAALLAARLATFRVVEPIRQADLRSRRYIETHLAHHSNNNHHQQQQKEGEHQQKKK